MAGPAICSIFVFVILFQIFIPLQFTIPICVIIFTLVLTLTHYYVSENQSSVFNSTKEVNVSGTKTGIIIVSSIYGISLLILTFFSSPTEIVYKEWNDLGIVDIAKACTAVAVCFFLPGYSLISVVFRKDGIKPLLKILLSYLTSILFTGIVGFTVGFAHVPFYYSSWIVISFGGIFLFLYVYYMIFTGMPKTNYVRVNLELLRARYHFLIVFVCILALIIIWTYFLYDFKIIGDQWFHHGRSLLFMTDSIGNLSKLDLESQYPPFFSGLLGTYFTLSGMPSVNAYVLINFLNIVPVFGFFFFFKQWAPRLQKNAALLATALFVLSAGLGWIYIVDSIVAINPQTQFNAFQMLHYGGIKTFDIRIPSSFIGVGHPDITTPLILVGLPCGFVLLGLLKSEMKNRFRTYCIVGTVIVTGSLFHDEFYLFVLISAIVSIAMSLKGKHMYYFLPLFMFATEILIDQLFHTNYYATREIGNIPLLYLLIGSLSLMWLVYARRVTLRKTILSQISSRLRINSIRTRWYAGIIVIAIVVYLYAFTFIVWNHLLLSDIQLQTSESGQRIIPWYLYPNRLGLSGALGLIYLASYLFRKFEKSAWIFAIFAFISFIAGPYYDENRFNKYIELSFVSLASLLLFEVISNIKHRLRPIIISMVLGLVFLGSSMSILLYFSYSVLGLKNEDFSQFSLSLPRRIFPSPNEINFLNYLHKSLIVPSTDFVAAPSYDMVRNQGLGSKLEGFVDPSITKFSQNPLIFNSTSLESLYSLLSYSNIKYVLLSLNDTLLPMTDPLKFAINHFRQVYRDDEFEVFAVPRISAPSTNSDVGLLYRDDNNLPHLSKELIHYLPLSTLALSNIKYDVFKTDDLSALQKKVLILPEEVLTSNLLEFAKNGGTIVLLHNFNKTEIFDSTLSIREKGKATMEFDKIENINGSSIQVSGSVIPKENKNSNSSVISYYYKDGQRVAPFSTMTNWGSGKIILVDNYPYFRSIVERPDTYFSSLSEFLKIAGVKTNAVENPEVITIYPPPRFYGPLNIIGNVRISTESLSLVSPSDIQVNEIKIVKGNEILLTDKNVIVKNLTILGKGNIVIESNKFKIPISSDFNYFTGLIPGVFDIQIKIGNQSKLELAIDPKSKNVTVSGAVVLLKGIAIKNYTHKDIPIVVKRPGIEANGTIDFRRLYSYDPNDYTKGWAFNVPVTIHGYINVNLTQSDGYYLGVNSQPISYIKWNSFKGGSNIISESIRLPADISALSKQRNSQIPVVKAFLSEVNLKTIALISVLAILSLWLVRSKLTLRLRT